MAEKLTLIPNKERDEDQASLSAFERDLPYNMRYAELNAKLRYARFKASIAAGFDEDQALQLCSLED